MFRALRYLFSCDNDACNPIYYCAKVCEGNYVKQSFVSKPYVRETTTRKSDAAWMNLSVASSLVASLKTVGYADAKVEKVHWWSILKR